MKQINKFENFNLTEIDVVNLESIIGGENEIVQEQIIGTETRRRVIYCDGRPEENYGDWGDEGC